MRKGMMTIAEVSKYLDVSRENVLKLLHEDEDFPQPVIHRNMYTWDENEIEEWADNNGYEDDDNEEETEDD